MTTTGFMRAFKGRRTRMWASGLAAILLLSLALDAAAGTLRSHRALYDLRLIRAGSGVDLVAVTGALYYRYEATCTGITSESRSNMVFIDSVGNSVANGWSMTGWEETDGGGYSFWTRETENGRQVTQVRGRADLETRKARYREPEDLEFDLPQGTVFPNRHIHEVLDAAAKGSQFLFRTLFDGADDRGPIAVNAAIGRPVPPLAEAAPVLAAGGLEPAPVWPVRFAFFSLDADGAEPDLEMGAHYRPDGIAERVDQDFGDFAIRADLVSIEPLAVESCP